MFVRSKKTALKFAAVTAGAVLMAASAQAQPLGGQGSGAMGGGAMGHELSPEQQAFVQEFLKKQGELNRIQERLAQVEQQVVENNSEVQALRSDLEGKVADRMREAGVEPDSIIDELQGIAGKLDGGISDEAERNSLIQEFETKREQFLSAQQRALQDAEVQATQEKLQDTVLTAMKQIEPDTESMLDQLRAKERELQEMQLRAMQMQ